MTGEGREPKDDLLRHGIFLMIASQVGNLSNLAFHMVMGRKSILAQGEYGTLGAILSLLLIVRTPVDSLRASAAHFTAMALSDRDLDRASRMIQAWGRWMAIVASLAAILLFAIRRPFAEWLHIADPAVITVAAMALFGAFFIPLVTGALQGLQAFRWMAITAQAEGVIRVLAGWLLVVGLQGTAVIALGGQVAGVFGALLVGAVGLALLLPKPSRGAVDLRASGAYLMRSAIALSAFSVLMMMDMPLVKHFCSDQADDFARASTIARTVIFLPMPIAMAMFPKVVSAGRITADSRRIFWRALGMVGGLVILGVLGCILLPWLPLYVLYGKANATPAACMMVRVMVLALAPLSLVYLLLNFEMAQQRFRAIPVLCAAGAVYVGGAFFFPGGVLRVATMLAIGAVIGVIGLLGAMPLRELLGRSEAQ